MTPSHQPDTKCTTTERQKRSIFNKLNIPANHKDKQDIFDSEGKLQQLGYVDYVRNLSEKSHQTFEMPRFTATFYGGPSGRIILSAHPDG